MSGIKGRSGRKPLLAEKTLEEILSVSADILLRFLINPEVPNHKKVIVAKELVLKHIPPSMLGDDSNKDVVNLFNIVKFNGRDEKVNPGSRVSGLDTSVASGDTSGV